MYYTDIVMCVLGYFNLAHSVVHDLCFISFLLLTNMLHFTFLYFYFYYSCDVHDFICVTVYDSPLFSNISPFLILW